MRDRCPVSYTDRPRFGATQVVIHRESPSPQDVLTRDDYYTTQASPAPVGAKKRPQGPLPSFQNCLGLQQLGDELLELALRRLADGASCELDRDSAARVTGH